MTTERKPWWKQPGEVYDAKGYPIYPGDLIRTFHFIGGPRRKRYYLYHVAVFIHGYMELVPVHHLQPERIKFGGRCMLSDNPAQEQVIIDGHGPGELLSYEDRPKIKWEKDQ